MSTTKPTFADNDVGLMKIRYGIAAAKKTEQLLGKLYKKYNGTKHLPDSRPTVVPHTMFAGPGGCHSKDAEILMYDGSIKAVQDVEIGDELTGPDSQPRKVLQLVRGEEVMYTIVPDVGQEFTVNGNHTLNLAAQWDSEFFPTVTKDITVIDYVANPCFKGNYKLWKPSFSPDGFQRIDFTVKIQDNDQYYGFTLDKDHLYLTGDFIVHHNCGKTRRVEAAAELMGCSEKDGTFIKLTPDAIRHPEHLLEILQSKLSWKGYMDVNGKIDHAPGELPEIVDPKHPVGPVQNIAVFIDEIHDLSDAVLNAMLLVLYEYEYQYTDKDGKFNHLYFPKFTCFGATTDLGELPSPLQTRFPNQIEIEYYTDEEMVDIVMSMAKGRDLQIEDDAAFMLAHCSQGVARMAENHVRGLYEAACYHQPEQTNILTTNLALQYLSTAQYLPDGLKYRQVMILDFLAGRGEKNGNPIPAGEQAICDSIGVDRALYKQNLEPRLMHRDLILRTARGRSITEDGVDYLNKVKTAFPQIFE